MLNLFVATYVFVNLLYNLLYNLHYESKLHHQEVSLPDWALSIFLVSSFNYRKPEKQ